jgi:ATP-dependent DNA ligase
MSFEFCLPTRGSRVPTDPDWLHEIKYDGYRLRLERDPCAAKLSTTHEPAYLSDCTLPTL